MRDRNVIRPGATVRRVHFHHDHLEEYEGGAGMWQDARGPDRQLFIDASAALMRDPGKFRDAMRMALSKWPNSCLNAFTATGNHRAWIGHAGCYLATGSPEESTRLGWHTLDDGEQHTANAAADDVIAEWRAAALHQHTLQFDLFDILEGRDA